MRKITKLLDPTDTPWHRKVENDLQFWDPQKSNARYVLASRRPKVVVSMLVDMGGSRGIASRHDTETDIHT